MLKKGGLFFAEFMKNEGVIPVCCLNTLLNVDLVELQEKVGRCHIVKFN